MRAANSPIKFAAGAFAALAAMASPAKAIDPLDNTVTCGVFDPAPCNPSFCSVFGPWPCVPALPPGGQGLQLTIRGISPGGARPAGSIDTIRDLFAALRACWQPPEQAASGLQMTVRFSFKRTGELFGPPRMTYVTPGTEPEVRQSYRHAIEASLERCTPLSFSAGMAGAIAGRPIAIRFIDDRD